MSPWVIYTVDAEKQIWLQRISQFQSTKADIEKCLNLVNQLHQKGNLRQLRALGIETQGYVHSIVFVQIFMHRGPPIS